MPSSATITSFYSFAANTKARATQVNSNFSLFRGHVIPIEPLTATASDQNYDLGSTEYHWRTGYFQKVDLVSSTSTAALQMRGFTSETAGAIGFYINNTLTSKITPSGFDGAYVKTASMPPTALTQRARLNSTFVTSTANVVVPDYVSHLILEGIGGGGGGGGGGLNVAATITSGGAGGASGLMGVIVVPVTAGETITVTIQPATAGGPGGGGAGSVAAGVTATAGTAGGDTTVTGSFGTVTFKGGRGGPGGSAASVSGGASAYQGGMSSSSGGGCITGVFGTPSAGDASIRAVGGAAGANGASGTGGGGGGGGFGPGGAGGAGTPANGSDGSLGGGGGGGGGSTATNPGTGGVGGKGCVIVHYVTYS